MSSTTQRNVTCSYHDRIIVLDQAGQRKRTVVSQGNGDGQFDCPHGIFIKGDVMYTVCC